MNLGLLRLSACRWPAADTSCQAGVMKPGATPALPRPPVLLPFGWEIRIAFISRSLSR